MSDKNTGGNAFPREDYQTDTQQGQCGMSLRDYFAASAMNGLLASIDADDDIDQLPSLAYLLADEMLAERAK